MDTTNDSSATPAPALTVRVADAADLPEVLRVQHAGFDRVARRFGFPRDQMAPLTETVKDLAALLAGGVRTFVAVTSEGSRETVVGTVRATVREGGVVEIGRLAVDDGLERGGIASALMGALEDAYPDTARFELYTGSEAEDALALYDRLGYRTFWREDFATWTRVWLAKDRGDATATSGAPLH